MASEDAVKEEVGGEGVVQLRRCLKEACIGGGVVVGRGHCDGVGWRCGVGDGDPGSAQWRRGGPAAGW
jgi:hypothetical protein